MEPFSFLFALPFLLLLSSTPATPIHLNSTTDQDALVAFKNSITSDPYGVLSSNWTDDSPLCHWIGVSCGIKHQRVTALNISRFGLGGNIDPHLGNLTFLGYLDISYNNFTGFIPSELSKLRRLKWIDFGVNSFTGQVPSWLGTLPKLERLNLENNVFSGRIPPSLFSNSKLEFLSMSSNALSGNIPEEIENSSSLKGLYLSHNQLSGSIPYGIFNLSSMREIYVMDNRLTGRLPSDMCNNIPSLKKLALSANQLSGQIPPNIQKCKRLEILSLSINHFNGYIPSEIGSLSMLRKLYLGSNDFKGGIPAGIGNLSRLEILSFESASLTEYGMEGKVSTNGDVYSYGIMLFEIFTGKKPTDDMFDGELNLKEWVGEALRKNAIIEVLAPNLLSTEHEHFSGKQQCIISIFELAMKCLVDSPEERINMIEVGALLHKIKGRLVADTMLMQRHPYTTGRR